MAFFLFRKRFWVQAVKFGLLAYFAVLAILQVPELLYDFGPSSPTVVSDSAALRALPAARSRFVTLRGQGEFDQAAFQYRSHGLDGTYFLLKGYDSWVVVRTYDKVTDDWKVLDRHVGRLQPYRTMAFSRTIRKVYQDRFGVTLPANGFYLARDDVPAASAWGIGATVFCILAFLAVLYFGFFWHGRKPRLAPMPQPPGSAGMPGNAGIPACD